MKFLMILIVLMLSPVNSKADDAESLKLQGINAASGENFEEAIQLFSQAITLSPNDGAAYAFRGFSYSKKGNLTKARNDFDKAIALNPTFAGGWMGRASVHLKLFKYERAVQDATESLRLKPADPATLYIRGEALRSVGRYADSIADLDEAIRISPSTAALYLGKGKTLVQMGQIDGAFQASAKALELSPENPASKDFAKALAEYVPSTIVATITDQSSLDAASQRISDEIRKIGSKIPDLRVSAGSGTIYPVLTDGEVSRLKQLMTMLDGKTLGYGHSLASVGSEVLVANERAIAANKITEEASRVAESEPPVTERDTGGLVVYYISFMISEYCANAGASFTPNEVEGVKAEIKKISDSSGFTQAEKDKAWNASVAAFSQQKSSLTLESCAADRQQMTYTIPSAFMPNAGESPNPF